jgi:hypothetical protein
MVAKLYARIPPRRFDVASVLDSAEELVFEQRWNTGEWSRPYQAGACCNNGMLHRLVLEPFTTPPPRHASPTRGYRCLNS